MQEISKTIPKKTRNSIYYLTINSNMLFKNDSDSIAQFHKFEKAVDTIFSENNIFDYVTFRDNTIDNLSLIKEVIIDIAYEVAGNQMNRDRIHAHILLAFRKHKTNIKLNFAKIKADVKHLSDLPSIYFNCQLVQNITTFEEIRNRIQVYGEKFNLLQNIQNSNIDN